MIIFKNKLKLQEYLSGIASSKVIGFVPTMGALHMGHISLIKEANKKCDVTVCSIYINPRQFNDKTDLLKYPKPINLDIELLIKNECDILYLPEGNDVYENNENSVQINLGNLENIWEAKHRPGHFDGVIAVVKKLFDIVKPNKVFFGRKDLQQCLVIKKLIQHFSIPVEFNICDTVRENDGLAMSSRNKLLTDEERITAANIPRIISDISKNISVSGIKESEKNMNEKFSAIQNLKIDYAAIVSSDTLEPTDNIQTKLTIIVAVKIGNIRLIDNQEIILQ